MSESPYHIPVLLKESVDGLNIKPNGIYVDVTFGGGGHSKEILSRLGENGHLYSFDQDADAELNLKGQGGMDKEKEIADDPRFTFVRSNFRYLKNWMRYYGVDHVDGLLADLGVSSHHFDDETRGFSFRFDAPLDMRMNKRAGQTAADLLNHAEETKLADIFYLYGEMKNARRLAAAIAKKRTVMGIQTTQDLLDAIGPMLPKEREKKEMAKVFQALRIEVNHEMDALKEMLKGATEVLCEGGRLSIITYHSLEDRIVKNVMKAGNAEGKVEQDFFGRIQSPFQLVNGKVITPSEEEQQRNPRSRSAKHEETPSLQEAIKEQAREDEAAQSSTFTLRRILGGDFLTTQMLRRQIGVILLCVVFIIIYISNRYSCQKKMLEIDKLNIELQDAKYKSLSSASELTERCRESNVLDMLKTNKDSLLKIPAQPPYIIEVPN